MMKAIAKLFRRLRGKTKTPSNGNGNGTECTEPVELDDANLRKGSERQRITHKLRLDLEAINDGLERVNNREGGLEAFVQAGDAD